MVASVFAIDAWTRSFGRGAWFLVDVSIRRLLVNRWSNEYDLPMYFVELHDDYRCGWFQQEGARLAMPKLLEKSWGWSPGCLFP
jgi:hypothetical protein